MALQTKVFKKSIDDIINAAVYREAMHTAKAKNDPMYKKFKASMAKAKKYRDMLKRKYSKQVRSKVIQKLSH